MIRSFSIMSLNFFPHCTRSPDGKANRQTSLSGEEPLRRREDRCTACLFVKMSRCVHIISSSTLTTVKFPVWVEVLWLRNPSRTLFIIQQCSLVRGQAVKLPLKRPQEGVDRDPTPPSPPQWPTAMMTCWPLTFPPWDKKMEGVRRFGSVSLGVCV